MTPSQVAYALVAVCALAGAGWGLMRERYELVLGLLLVAAGAVVAAVLTSWLRGRLSDEDEVETDRDALMAHARSMVERGDLDGDAIERLSQQDES